MKLHVVLCWVLLSIAANVHAEEKRVGIDWLELAASAGHQIDYQGVFVYQYGHHIETSSIIHINEAGSEYGKLESLDGPKREIISHDGQVWSYNNHKMAQIDSQQGRGKFPYLSPEQLSALNANYQAKLLGVERVAGYDAQVVLFQPKDNLRYMHKMWVHTATGLLLKAVVLDEKSQEVEQYAFIHLQIGGKIDHSWKGEADLANVSGKHIHHSLEAEKSFMPVNSGWVADMLPAGFRKTLEILRPMHGKHAPVTQIVYSDGLGAISIFIEPNDNDEDDVDGLFSRGAISLYQKVSDQYLFTVVGEIPPRTVMQVMNSIRFNGK